MAVSRSLLAAFIGPSMLLGTILSVRAQDGDLSAKATRFVGENGLKYIQPAVSVFSASLNSGLYHTADVHDVLGFEIGLIGMLAPVSVEKKTFLATAPDTVRYDGNVYVAGRDYDRQIRTSTALGAENGTKVYYKQGTPDEPPIYQFPGGVDLRAVPIVTPQVSVGLPLRTEIVLRYLPKTRLSDEVGGLRFLGVGFRHSLSQWTKGPSPSGVPSSGESPLNMSVHFMYQKFTLEDSAGGDFIDTKAFSVGVQASKSLWFITFYGGLAYENAITNISYTYRPTSEYYPEARNYPVNVRLREIKGENNLRTTVGINLRLLLFDLFADYSIASQPVASFGVVLTIR